uniref:Uncharacterized protein n=1 Tax=Arundo donax TaxID=35708 RepID=A0A0A8Y3B8_ARUDO
MQLYDDVTDPRKMAGIEPIELADHSHRFFFVLLLKKADRGSP